jgi:hypothetical protein
VSRHSFTRDADTWTVGYDRPLNTFYAQVEPCQDLSQDGTARAAFLERHAAAGAYDPDDLLLTVVGDQPRESPTLAHLTSALAARAVELPDEVRTLLERDHLQAVAPAPPATVTRHLATTAATRAGKTAQPTRAVSSTPAQRKR